LRLVLLPGLNGSDRLFAPLLPWLDSQLTVQTLSLPQEGSQNHQQLAEALRSQLGETPFVLLGESFSGALAYHLGMLKPPGLRGLIFAASFLQRPQPLLRLLPKPTLPLPISLLTNSWLLKTFCIGKCASPELVSLLRTEIHSIGNASVGATVESCATATALRPIGAAGVITVGEARSAGHSARIEQSGPALQ
jgi:pimeloyl-ACP methyl ester carboxylesterase